MSSRPGVGKFEERERLARLSWEWIALRIRLLSRVVRRHAVIAIALGIYVGLVGYQAFHHELWRDEVRALNIAAGSRTPLDLVHNLRNEGHPILWYLLLYAGYHLTGSMLVLKPLALLIAAGAMVLWLRFSPFPVWQRLLLLFGQLPLYEYSVMCRNYGISMLLMFALAALYPQRFRQPLRMGVLLALLANTNAHSLVLSGAWLVALVLEGLLHRPPERAPLWRLGIGLLLAVSGMAFSAWVLKPDETTLVNNVASHDWITVQGALLTALGSPVSIHGRFLGLGFDTLLTVLFWLLVLSFLRRPWLAASLVVAALGIALFPLLIYALDLRHGGLFLIFVVSLLWIDAAASRAPGWPRPLERLWDILAQQRAAAFSLFLLGQVCLAVPLVRLDLTNTLSGAASLGRFLRSDPALRHAIVLGDPEPALEALPYYTSSQVFLNREDRFLIKVSLTTANRQELSLAELLQTGERLKAETGRPVVFALGHQLGSEGPFERWTGFGKVFRYDEASLDRFLERTTALGYFGAMLGDESFQVFRLR